MGILGKPFRVLYEAKRFRTGLTDVQAAVFKPNGLTAGIFPMPEMPGMFAGRYHFVFNTTIIDQEGEYFAGIFSPTEGIETTLRIPLYLSNTQAPTGPVANLLQGTIDSRDLSGVISDKEDISGQVSEDNLEGLVMEAEDVEGGVSSDGMSGTVQQDDIDGTVES